MCYCDPSNPFTGKSCGKEKCRPWEYQEAMRELTAERDALKAEISELKVDLCAAHKRIEAERNGFESVLAELEAARKQEPAVLIEGKKIFWNPEYKGVHDGGFYASPVPAQQPTSWEEEAKRAFWHGWMLASGEKCDGHAEFLSYIDKRKSELKGGENER